VLIIVRDDDDLLDRPCSLIKGHATQSETRAEGCQAASDDSSAARRRVFGGTAGGVQRFGGDHAGTQFDLVRSSFSIEAPSMNSVVES